MKYYIYISDTKIDMLYPQIPQPLLKKIASSLSIDLKLLGAEVNIGAKGNPSEETRYAKVRIVSEYIEKHLDVGSIDAPSTYFKGKLPMRWELYNRNEPLFSDVSMQQIVFFGGITPLTFVGLGGSSQHLIGSNLPKAYSSSMPDSSFNNISNMLIHVAYAESHGLPSEYAAQIVNQSSEGLLTSSIAKVTQEILGDRPKQHLEFLAKTLWQDRLSRSPFMKDDLSKHVVLGTPIYVAIDD